MRCLDRECYLVNFFAIKKFNLHLFKQKMWNFYPSVLGMLQLICNAFPTFLYETRKFFDTTLTWEGRKVKTYISWSG